MLIAGGSAVLLVVALIVVQQVTSSGSSRPDPSNLTGVADVQTEFDGLTERAGTIGNPSAKVTITEFGDLRCPICKTFDNEVVPPGHLRHRAPGHGQAAVQDLADPRAELGRRGQGGLRGLPAERALALRRADLPEPGRRERGVVHAGVARARPRRRPRHRALRQGPRQPRLRPRRSARSPARRRAGFQGTPTIRVAGPKGTITVDATYDAIATGVQQVSGSSAGEHASPGRAARAARAGRRGLPRDRARARADPSPARSAAAAARRCSRAATATSPACRCRSSG